MNNLDLSEKELELVKQYSVAQPLSRVIIFYFCVLTAPLAFALYGAYYRDSVAILVAFVGLLVFMIWYIASSTKNEKTMNSLFNKILKSQLSK